MDWFGLERTADGWTYDHGKPTEIMTLAEVAELAKEPGKGREPDFFELLKAVILDGSLAKGEFVEHPIFGLQMPKTIPGAGIPDDILNPRSNWTDKNAYDTAATKLAKLFRENDKKFEMSESVRAAGPKA